MVLVAARPLVSVIMPAYNSQKYIDEAMDSVLAQTCGDLEVLVTDDASSDATADLVAWRAQDDARVHLLRQSSNKGAAQARNRGLAQARGRYIAYLDADDVWEPDKVERQLELMGSAHLGACITAYRTMEEDGTYRNTVHVPASIGYHQFLRNTVTCTLSLVVDTETVDRDLLAMPDLRRGQDAATWLQVMRAGHRFHGLDVPLASYRKTPGSLSSSRLQAVRRTWHVYRQVERLPVPYAAYCLGWQLYHAVLRRRSAR